MNSAVLFTAPGFSCFLEFSNDETEVLCDLVILPDGKWHGISLSSSEMIART